MYQPQMPNLGEPSDNANQNRFVMETDVSTAKLLKDMAAMYGLKYNPAQHKLIPLLLTRQLPFFIDAALDDRTVVLSANTPTGLLEFRFDDAVFILGITATVLAPRILRQGQPEQNFFNADISPADYVYVKFFREGSSQVYMQRQVPLSEFSGKGPLDDQFLFTLIPVLERGEVLAVEVSIIPEGTRAGDPPPFVESIGALDISLHTHKWEPFGTS